MASPLTRPRVSVYIATSLDGFIARTDGGLDWLEAQPAPAGEDFGYAAFFATVDALVMGRSTFDQVLRFDAWPYADRLVCVLTSRPLELPAGFAGRVRAVSGSPRELLASLGAAGVRHVYLDGGVTIQQFLAERLVDELTVTRLPVLLGSGRPLFGRLPSDLPLRHLGTRAFANGYVQSRYAPAHEVAAA
jgi:dihydrofolate reductase